MSSLHRSIRLSRILPLAALVIGLTACGGSEGDTTTAGTEDTGAGAPAGGSNLSGSIAVDGSSTVFPITEAMSEEFQIANNAVKVTVGVSGTGGGFKKFCAGETDISNASRPIKEEEAAACTEKGIEFIELPIAFDALTVVTNLENDWAKCLTVEELKKMWEPAAKGKITNWSQIRSGFPSEPLVLYGPGTDSGTFDYFTDEINGEEGATRSDFQASEDDNTLVTGVEGGKGALGYFGFAYYEENAQKLNAVEIDAGDGCVPPSSETVLDGTYKPLARPIFIYVKKESMERPEVKAFVEFYLAKENEGLVGEVGYVNLPENMYSIAQERLSNQTTGSDPEALNEGA
jgi:phosphate transport system substrate-binding protein